MAQEHIQDGESGQSVIDKFNGNSDDVTSHKSSVSNPHAVTKAQVGLGNCENTADANKPVSLATQSALDAKANIERTSDNGVILSFARDAVYGTPETPEVGNISYTAASGRLGVEILLIHEDEDEPTYGSEFKKMDSSSAYVPSEPNYIWFKYISEAVIIFRIENEI